MTPRRCRMAATWMGGDALYEMAAGIMQWDLGRCRQAARKSSASCSARPFDKAEIKQADRDAYLKPDLAPVRRGLCRLHRLRVAGR